MHVEDINILLNKLKEIKEEKTKYEGLRFVIDRSMIFLGAIFLYRELTENGIKTFRIDTTKQEMTYSMDGQILACCGIPPTLRDKLKQEAKKEIVKQLKNNKKILL